MGRVASFATVYANGRVLIEERSSFVGVTFKAWLLVLQAGVDHVRPAAHLPRRSVCTVRVVTIRTRHEPLIYPMFKGLSKLGADIVVAPVADVHLPLCQEIPVGFGLVNRVA